MKLYKLSNGETIITETTNNLNEHYLDFLNPFMLLLHQTENGIQFSLHPWMHVVSTIRKDAIIAFSDVPDVIKEEYIKITSPREDNKTNEDLISDPSIALINE